MCKLQNMIGIIFFFSSLFLFILQASSDDMQLLKKELVQKEVHIANLESQLAVCKEESKEEVLTLQKKIQSLEITPTQTNNDDVQELNDIIEHLKMKLQTTEKEKDVVILELQTKLGVLHV